MERHKNRKTTFAKKTGKQKIKHRNVTLKFMNITEMMKNMSKSGRELKLKKRITQNQKIIKKTIQTNERKQLKRKKRS